MEGARRIRQTHKDIKENWIPRIGAVAAGVLLPLMAFWIMKSMFGGGQQGQNSTQQFQQIPVQQYGYQPFAGVGRPVNYGN